MISNNPSIISLLSTYLIVVNLIAFLTMGLDKARAKGGCFRIPERTLLLLALIGGVGGSILGMKFFHHKTRKQKFSLGLPLIMLGWGLILYLIFYK